VSRALAGAAGMLPRASAHAPVEGWPGDTGGGRGPAGGGGRI
jgi:hypothetical protein